MSDYEMLGEKLNKGLDPKKFEICVPKKSRLLMNWELDEAWEKYLSELAEAYDLKWVPKRPYEDCLSCDCKPGRVLRGDWAIAHACRVHDRIHRQALGLELVSAIDVGFAIKEQDKKFDNLLAIRIHVNRKQSPDQLIRLGFASLTQSLQAVPKKTIKTFLPPLGSSDDDKDGPEETPQPPPCEYLEGVPCTCCFTERYEALWRLLREEFEDFQFDSTGRQLRRILDRYPISGIGKDDLTLFCEGDGPPKSLDDVRLCICGVPIDVINAEYNPSAANHPGGDADSGVFVDEPKRSDELSDAEVDLIGRGRVNPLVGGVSVGSITGQAGTLGTIVWDRTDGTPCVLSNWHVLAGTPTAQVGQPTYQPALFDGGTEDDVVAHLKRWRLDTEGDAAIAELSGSRDYASGEVLGLWHPISGYLAPKLNMEVRKWGRTTGFTKGFVDGIHLATNIDYGGGVVRYFKEQFHIAPVVRGQDVSQVGDSGSLVVTSLRPVETQDALEKICEWLKSGLAPLILDCNWKGVRSKRELKTAIRQAIGNKNSEGFIKKCLSKCHAISGVCGILREFRRKCVTHRSEDKDLCCCLYEYSIYLKEECCSIRKKIRQLEKLVGDRAASKESMGLLQELRECYEFCIEVHEAFECWYKECQLIDFFGNLHKLANNLTHKDPLEFVRILEEEVSKPHQCSTDADSIGQQYGKLQSLQDCTDAYELGCLEKLFAKDLEDLGYDPNRAAEENWFVQILRSSLDPEKALFKALVDQVTQFKKDQDDAEERAENRAYYAVGLIFAGDTPGSPFGEFAVASEVSRLAETLRFSLRPVFEPRSSFRELRVRPTRQRVGEGAVRSRRGIGPRGGGDDPRGGGPQPDTEPFQSGSGSGSGGG